MTGTIVQLDYRGTGEIRSPETDFRVPFIRRELLNIPFADALGAEVSFDVAKTANGDEAIRIRRRRDAKGAA